MDGYCFPPSKKNPTTLLRSVTSFFTSKPTNTPPAHTPTSPEPSIKPVSIAVTGPLNPTSVPWTLESIKRASILKWRPKKQLASGGVEASSAKGNGDGNGKAKALRMSSLPEIRTLRTVTLGPPPEYSLLEMVVEEERRPQPFQMRPILRSRSRVELPGRFPSCVTSAVKGDDEESNRDAKAPTETDEQEPLEEAEAFKTPLLDRLRYVDEIDVLGQFLPFPPRSQPPSTESPDRSRVASAALTNTGKSRDTDTPILQSSNSDGTCDLKQPTPMRISPLSSRMASLEARIEDVKMDGAGDWGFDSGSDSENDEEYGDRGNPDKHSPSCLPPKAQPSPQPQSTPNPQPKPGPTYHDSYTDLLHAFPPPSATNINANTIKLDQPILTPFIHRVTKPCHKCHAAQHPLEFPSNAPTAACTHAPHVCSHCLRGYIMRALEKGLPVRCLECGGLLGREDVVRGVWVRF